MLIILKISGTTSLIANLEKNWLNCKPQWVHHYRYNIYNRGTNTNNRIERHNRSIKTKVKTTDHLVESIKNLIQYAYHIQKTTLNII